jgi:FkbM family methyltransferase
MLSALPRGLKFASVLPVSVQDRLRECYWRIKSKFLYQTLYRALRLEHTLRSGLTVKVSSMGEWWTYNDIFVDGEYDLAILTALNTVPPERPLVVLDLGANVGYFAFRILDLLAGKKQSLDITMVEGSPKTFAELKKRMSSERERRGPETLICGLVGQPQGSAFIRESAIHVKSMIVNTVAAQGTEVNFVDLNSVMGERPEIDLLKCDIEGSELLFIQNYPDLLRKVKHAVFELHHDQCDTKESVKRLEDLGFRATLLRDCGSFSVNLFSRNLR